MHPHPSVDDAAESAILVAKLNQQSQHLAAIDRITRTLRHSSDVSEVLHYAVKEITQALEVSYTVVVQVEVAQQQMLDLLQGHLLAPEIATSLLPWHCHYQATLSQDIPVVLPDIASSLELGCVLPNSLDLRSLLIVPLVCQHSHLGEISLLQCHHQRNWTADEVVFVRSIADHCALALYQSSFRQPRPVVHRADLFHQRSYSLGQYDHLPAMVYSIDEQGCIYDVNRRYLEQLGYSREEMLGKKIIDFMTPESAERFPANMLQFWQKGYARDIPYQYLRKDGTVLDVLLDCDTALNEEGNLISLSAMRNITPRRQVEAALDKSESQLQLALNSARMGAWQWDLTTGQTTYSHGADRLLGLPPGSLMSSDVDFYAGVHPGDRVQVTQAIDQAIMGEGTYDVDYRILSYDGSLRWVRSKGEVLWDDRGKPVVMVGIVMDITDRQLAGESHRFQANLLDAVKQAVIATNIDGEILYWNQFAETLYGYPADLAIGQDIAEVISSPDLQAQSDNILALLEFGDSWVGELMVQHYNGRAFPVMVTASPIYDYEETLIGIVSISIDITERKQMEASLRKSNANLGIVVEEQTLELKETIDRLQQETAHRHQSEQRFRNLVETSNDWIWEVDENLVYTYVSPKVREVLGYEPKALLGTTLYNLMPPLEADRVAQIFATFATEQHPFTCLENTNIHHGGRIVVLETSGTPFFDQTGRFCGYRGIARDITDRKLAEAALRESETRFRQIAENIPDVFWITPSDMKQILYVSPAYEEVWGRSCASLYQSPQSLIEAVHPDDRAQILLAQKESTQQEHSQEYRIVRPDGSIRWILDRAFPVRDEAGNLLRVVGLAKDVTDRKLSEAERKQAEAETLAALAKARELSELKSRFISITSHEFRTPLTTILASTSLLKNFSHKLSPEDKEKRLHKIEVEVGNMTTLLEDVLLIGQAEAGQTPFNPLDLKLREFCQDLVEEVKFTIGATHEFDLICPYDQETVAVDEKLMRQILMNLLSNAIKYSTVGSIISLTVELDAENVIFQVQDQGIGIPEADREHLFQAFHRAKNVGTISGTGLGLSIVKNAVTLHRGTITIDSQIGVGTTFTVCLPNSIHSPY